MPEPPSSDRAPVPIRPRRVLGDPPAPPERIVRELRASLRASDVYAGLVIDRLELAWTRPDLLRGVPAHVIAQLTAASEAFQTGADRVLAHLDPAFAERAARMAELMRERSRASDDRKR
ncbi:MAG TPA: hypothetical protein VFF79_15590 [Conexibacter sp.]|jgi:hypothetical protein|nr:hypothetical protein [Conexibacter sp.]